MYDIFSLCLCTSFSNCTHLFLYLPSFTFYYHLHWSSQAFFRVFLCESAYSLFCPYFGFFLTLSRPLSAFAHWLSSVSLYSTLPFFFYLCLSTYSLICHHSTCPSLFNFIIFHPPLPVSFHVFIRVHATL